MKTFCKLLVLSLFFAISLAGYCSNEVCRRCCQVTNTGCYNAYDQTIKGRFVSDYTFCQDCECSDPKVGCGWMVIILFFIKNDVFGKIHSFYLFFFIYLFGKAYNLGRVECASCDTLRSIERSTHLVRIC